MMEVGDSVLFLKLLFNFCVLVRRFNDLEVLGILSAMNSERDKEALIRKGFLTIRL